VRAEITDDAVGVPVAPSPLARYLGWREARRPDPIVQEHRRLLLAGLVGDVIEVGCGEGRNFAFYPTTVKRVLALEPDPGSRNLARREAERARVDIRVVGGNAEALPAANGSFDAAVCAWVLCTVPDPRTALAEIRRVLRPGGKLHFYEHVRADTRALALTQRFVDATFWPRMLGGCHTTRDTEGAIKNAGFQIDELQRLKHASSRLTIPACPHILGTASMRI
jgi:ubiquinone/menaquinone biosynthesis C-methylase UbiE